MYTTFNNKTYDLRFCSGGSLRQKRKGRKARKIFTKKALHVVFKVNKIKLRSRSLRSSLCFRLTQLIIKQYSRRFLVKIEQISIQNDHIHLLVRTTRRSRFHYFFRVVAGQIAQRFEQEGLLAVVTGTPKLGGEGSTKLWKHRPFSRIVLGRRGY